MVKRVKTSSVVESQLPSFVREDFPLVAEFLQEYYKSQENQSGTLDILQNIDKYVKVEEMTNLNKETTLTAALGTLDTVINVEDTTDFPDNYGLIQIDSEIITYTGKTSTSFTGCFRGFSGISSYKSQNRPDSLVFSDTAVARHSSGVSVKNLSVLFLQEFLKKVKTQVTPGFENRELYSGLNENLFIKQAKDFYQSKGADQSFEILFRALYGVDVEVLKPRDNLFQPSDAQYSVTKDLVVEAIIGDPLNLENRTLFQNEVGGFQEARGSVTKVEKFSRGEKDYYKLSLDYDFDKDINVFGSLFGDFQVHPKTRVITAVSAGSTILDVDSTVGFGSTGTLALNSAAGTPTLVSYTSKTLNQFFGCQNVPDVLSETEARTNIVAYGYEGPGQTNPIAVRVSAVLSEIEFDSDTNGIKDKDTIKIKSLGKRATDSKSNNWVFNIPSVYDASSVSLVDISDYTYRFITYDRITLYDGDSVNIISSDGISFSAEITSIENENTIQARIGQAINEGLSYKISKNLTKVNATNFPQANNNNANVQNAYLDSNDDLYIASPSLPAYFRQELKVKDRSISFSGSYSDAEVINIGFHGLYTGDSIVYVPGEGTNKLNIDAGVYFVKRVSSNEVSIYRSRSNIFNNIFIAITGTVTNNKFEIFRLSKQTLESQKLIRKFSNPENSSVVNETNPGQIGMLINGVEILNYKSPDSIFYGPIQKIVATAGGSGYDVVNPPILGIEDPVGAGATGVVSVEGSFEEIRVLDGGFDYIGTPTITISGGGGKGATAEADMLTVKHVNNFNAFGEALRVDLTNNTIGFSSSHKFRNGEAVIYSTGGAKNIGGISTDSKYYVNTLESDTYVKLHYTEEDAIAGINTVNLTSYGSGTHSLSAVQRKRIINSVKVTNPGSGYKNKATYVKSENINVYSNTIDAEDHGYNDGDILVYTALGTSADGLASGEKYYVSKVNNDQFRLSPVGVGTTVAKNFYYNTKQHVDITLSGSGNHLFNYEPVKVEVNGVIGITTFSGQDFTAKLQPIVRGEITGVSVSDGGVGYGSSEIIGDNRQPLFTLNRGSGAILEPVVINGAIVEVIIKSGGSGYNSPASLKVLGDGQGAELSPVITDGSITGVFIANSGYNYTNSKTSIDVQPAGSGASLQSTIKNWVINLFERALSVPNITDDDGYIAEGLNPNYGLEYTHIYAPRKFRQNVYREVTRLDKQVFVPDLIIDPNTSAETASKNHSPIIGWAYDGNPIYGPYGYDNPSGGIVRAMVSGYERVAPENRPPVSKFPKGFLVEDYIFVGTGDLDKYNGRYCVTPEYPNGTYAYFATISAGPVESVGPFKGYKLPQFPYFIGNEFRSAPIDFNFKKESNQDEFDLVSNKLVRNTTPYNTKSSTQRYPYFLDPTTIQDHDSTIKDVKGGKVESIVIKKSGIGYKVDDRVVFDNTGTSGRSASAKVSRVGGVEIKDIDVATTQISDVEFGQSGRTGVLVGYATQPHGLLNKDEVTISGLSTTNTGLQRFFSLDVPKNTLVLRSGIGSTEVTGIVTFISVSGDISEVHSDDIYKIEEEKVRVLNIDSDGSRLKVERKYDGTVGSSHTASTFAFEEPRRVFVNVGYSEKLDLTVNTKLYFDPEESFAAPNVGIATTLVSTGIAITFSNPGTGVTSVKVKQNQIYLKNHGLKTNTKLFYSANGSEGIKVSTAVTVRNVLDGDTLVATDYYVGISTFTLADNAIVYAARFNDDVIGIATNPIVSDGNGGFVGIGSTIQGLLHFEGYGSGNKHSFETDYLNTLSGLINRNVVTVSTGSTHNLVANESIKVDVFPGVTTSIKLSYNEPQRRILGNKLPFTKTDVNLLTNIITIPNHGFVTGQKVIYESSLSSSDRIITADTTVDVPTIFPSPLEVERPYTLLATETGVIIVDADAIPSNSIFYVVVLDYNRVQLAQTYYNATKASPTVVDMISNTYGVLAPINPPIALIRNQIVEFDLSDSSLSYRRGSTDYAAFEFNLYTDSNFKNKFFSSGTTSNFEVSSTGTVGTSGAKVSVLVSDDLPKNLYYKLDPVDLLNTPESKKEIIIDDENVSNNNAIIVTTSGYSGNHRITGVGTTSIQYNVLLKPERESYNTSQAVMSYSTSSRRAIGPINEVDIRSGGRGYEILPAITSIASTWGRGSILEAQSSSIGRVKHYCIDNIGFDYPSDFTLRPSVSIPQVLKLQPLSSIEKIGITSTGIGYGIAPDLIFIDGNTGNIVDVDLSYKIGDSFVTIGKNSTEIYNTAPVIVPVNNTNGVGISSITYDSGKKTVQVILNTVGYSTITAFPFAVGDKVLVENVSVGVGSTGKGFNSVNYDYKLFTVTETDPNIGGANPTITYSLDGDLTDGRVPGTFDPANSSGRVIPQKYFPIFSVTLRKNTFIEGETVRSGDKEGLVESWNYRGDDLNIRVISDDLFEVNDKVRGITSGSVASVERSKNYEARYITGSSSIVENGFNSDSGTLNLDLQRLHDNDYYQYFSYSLKSEIEIADWDNAVSSLDHTAGFKKFSDLQVVSVGATTGIATDQNDGDFLGIANIDQEIDLNCVNDYDLATENNIFIDGNLRSDEIILNSIDLQDYFESIGNRVLMIDDISDQFNDRPRPTRYSVIDEFPLTSFRARKYLLFVRDRRFTETRENIFVSVLHDDQFGYLNQYGRVETVEDMGYFDFDVVNGNGRLLFYPEKYRFNNFDITFAAYGLKDGISGVGNTALGSVAEIRTTTKDVPANTVTPIVSIANTYRASKLLIDIQTDDDRYEFDEFTLIHDGNGSCGEIDAIEYAQLTSHSRDDASSVGLGTYSVVCGAASSLSYSVGISTALFTSLVGFATAPNGTGIGDNGGFAIGSHLKVFGDTGIGTDKRVAITTSLDVQTLDTFVLTGVAGDDSNGGEEPMDAIGRNESLVLNYSIDGGTTFIGIGTIIGPTDVSAPLREYSLTIPVAARTSSTIFQIEQPTSDGSPYDEYGITHIGFKDSAGVDNIIVNFHPFAGVVASVDVLRVSIADTTSTGIGTTTLNTAIIDSHYTSIASTDSPVANTVATYDATIYNGGYYIVTVEDLTNGWSQVSELMVANNEEFNNITEFGEIVTMVTLGEFGVRRSGDEVQVTFEPNPDADMEVRVFQNAMRLVDPLNGVTKIDMNNGTVETGAAEYFGTDNDIKRQFELTHQTRPIFRRVFDPTSAGIVSITDNTIRIPQNFFVTGEEVQYTAADRFIQPSPIGIATTTIAGVSTDKLPTTLYIVKVDELNVQVAASASEALSIPPSVLDITSVGVGTIHRLDAKKQNTKALVTIDNMIQSPIAGTAVTVGLVTTVQPTTDRITLTGITSIFAGDLLRINNEIMKVATVGVGTTNVLIVNRPWMGTGLGTHFAGDKVTKLAGNYNIVNNQINFASPPYGAYPLSTTSGPVDERDWTGLSTHSTFSGRVFTKTSANGSNIEPYTYNTIFDDISGDFNGITTAFRLKSDGNDVTNVAEDNGIILIRDIYQGPRRADDVVVIGGDYELVEGSGITTAIFQENDLGVKYDNNTNKIPRGGLIVSVGSTQSRGYQPLISAGATATVSSGAITAISIGNTGSGYREWYQSEILVRAYNPVTGTSSTVGVASVFDGHVTGVRLDSPGTGYTTSNLPVISIDSPSGYSNIPMVYSNDYPNNSGVGTGLVVDIVVGQGSTVVDFNIVNYGFGYRQGDILTIPRSGIGSIPLDSGIGHIEFTLTVQKTYTDEFSGWTLGNFQRFDDISKLFNGYRTEFPLVFNGVRTSIRARKGSQIDIQAALLVFINDILQVPGEGYTFNGGSTITFTEAPLGYDSSAPYNGDQVKIIFYRGSKDIDVVLVDVLETIKPGDTVELYDDYPVYDEDPRLVVDITATDTLETNVYPGPGISTNLSYQRALQWCRQTEDKIINDQPVAKDREIYKALVNPAASILQDVGVGDTTIYVESVKTFFDSTKENASNVIKNTIEIVSQDAVCAAAATAVVSAAGTISSIVLTDPVTGLGTTGAGGSGYLTAPDVTISLPTGIGTTGRAEATANISNGIVTSFTITNPGYGYTFTNVPLVMISEPKVHKEELTGNGYKGDFGIIVGIATTTVVGTATTGVKGLVLNLDIEDDSFLRDPAYVGTAISETRIEVGDYFAINNSNLGLGITALRFNDGSVISYGSTFFDGIYQVANAEYGSNLAGTLIEETRYVTIDFEMFDSPVIVGPNDPDGTLITASLYTFNVTETIDSPVEIDTLSTARILNGVTITIDDIARTALIVNDSARAIIGDFVPSRITVRVEDYNGIETQFHPGSYKGRFYGDYSWGKINIPTRTSTRDFVGYSTEGYIGLSSSPFVRRKNPLKTINYL